MKAVEATPLPVAIWRPIPAPTPAEGQGPFQAAQEIVGDVSRRLSPAFHSVWGSVVPDIPDFCRELVAALAEE